MYVYIHICARYILIGGGKSTLCRSSPVSRERRSSFTIKKKNMYVYQEKLRTLQTFFLSPDYYYIWDQSARSGSRTRQFLFFFLFNAHHFLYSEPLFLRALHRSALSSTDTLSPIVQTNRSVRTLHWKTRKEERKMRMMWIEECGTDWTRQGQHEEMREKEREKEREIDRETEKGDRGKFELQGARVIAFKINSIIRSCVVHTGPNIPER